MHRIVLTATLVLWVSQVEADVLFTPDSFTLMVNPIFDDTGTNAVCPGCADDDPANNVYAELVRFGDVVGAEWNQFLGFAGLLRMQSSATDYSGLALNISLHATLMAWGASLPESLVNPSVSFGIIPGRLRGIGGGELVLECCDGFVGPLYIQQAFFPPSPFTIPPGGLSKLVALELHPFADQIAYTPVAPVPEPTSLILLGSALAASTLRRRRAKADTP